MTVVLRTPSVSYNALQANFDLYIATAFFDITLPSDYTTGMPLAFTATGGCAADGTEPTSFSYHFELSLYTADGGSILTATLDSNGYGFAVGTQTDYANTIAGSTQTATGSGVTILDSTFTTPINYQPSTLIDGSSFGYSGEGFVSDGAGHYHGPIGWFPNPTSGFTTTLGEPFAASQTVTAQVAFILDVEDDVNPDRSIYAFLESLTFQAGAHAVNNIPLTSLKVGWSSGVSYTGVRKGGPTAVTFGVQTNPLRTVDYSSAVNYPNLQQKSDLYLFSADITPPDDPVADSKRVDVLLRVATPDVIRVWSGLVRDLAIPSGGAETTDGAIYTALGELTGLPELAAALNGEAQRLDFTLSGVAVTGEVAALAADGAPDIRGAKVDVGLVLFDADWQLVPPVYWVWSGTADSLTVERGGDANNPTRTLRLSAGNVFTGRRRSNLTFFTDADQKRRSADDDFCDQVAKLSAGSTKVWGVG